MHSDPTPTGPGETARISALANNDPYRTEVLLLLNTLKENGKRYEQWMQNHERMDSIRFKNIEGRLAGAVSGVGDFRNAEAQVSGAKKLAVGIVSAFTLLGGFIYFIVWLVKELRS